MLLSIIYKIFRNFSTKYNYCKIWREKNIKGKIGMLNIVISQLISYNKN